LYDDILKVYTSLCQEYNMGTTSNLYDSMSEISSRACVCVIKPFNILTFRNHCNILKPCHKCKWRSEGVSPWILILGIRWRWTVTSVLPLYTLGKSPL